MKIKFLLAPALVIAFALLSSTMNAQQKNENQKNDGRSSLNVTTDVSAGSDETLINYTEEGHRYKIKLSGSKIIEMYMDDKKVAEKDYAKYDSLIKKLLAQIEQDRKQAEEDRKQAEKDRQQAGKDREQADENRKQAEKNRERADLDRKQAEKDRGQAEENKRQADKDRERVELDRKQAATDREQAGKDRKRAEIDRARADEDRKLLNEMVDELIKEKLVENKEALRSLVLDDNEFTVNGVKQPDSLHNKFKAKYLKSSRSRINYRNSGDSINISVD